MPPEFHQICNHAIQMELRALDMFAMNVSIFSLRHGAHFRSIRLFVLAALAITIMTSCDDDDPEVHDDHFETVGLVISVDGTEVLRLQDNQVTGSLALAADGEITCTVQFILEDGDIETPHGDEVLELSVEVDDAATAEVRDVNSDVYSFVLHGKQEGSAEVTISLLHEGHADYVSLPLPLEVAP